MSFDMDTAINESKNKKRAFDSSPSSDCCADKKVCTNQNIDHVISPVLPLVAKYDSSMDLTEFVRLVDNLKNKPPTKKIEVITNNYDKNPSEVASLFEKISTDETLKVVKLKNKFKNMAKSIRTGILSQMTDGIPHNSIPSSSNTVPTSTGVGL
uniref:Uncharacterized protein n=1 Tax=Cacopsylla melanoneura TaxID=428564 RepID=A0A8D8Z8N5_9HEMI